MQELEKIKIAHVEQGLKQNELLSILYHDIFDYPLKEMETVKWAAGEKVSLGRQVEVERRNGYIHIAGRRGLVPKRIMREKVSSQKLEIADKASFVLAKIPSVKMVAITGALAMRNASETSDIDLLIVVKSGSLWTSRLLVNLVLRLFGFKVRRHGVKDEKDKLCLNMWLDESDLVFRKRNAYTAHEIVQVLPLVNKDKTYERFIYKNRWVKDYWPNAVSIKKVEKSVVSGSGGFLEFLSRSFQLWYMRGKVTKETITATRAFFHPIDWGEYVLQKLGS